VTFRRHWLRYGDIYKPVLLIVACIAAICLITRCAPARTTLDAETCRDAADTRAKVAAAAQCPPGPFAECPNRDAIWAKWQQEMTACR
jgi:hypothetical protein